MDALLPVRVGVLVASQAMSGSGKCARVEQRGRRTSHRQFLRAANAEPQDD